MSEENKKNAETAEEIQEQEIDESIVSAEAQGDEQAKTAEAAELSREDELLAEIEQLKAEKEEMHNKYLRAQADLQNFRTRVNKEKEQMLQYSSQRAMEALLPVVDNFERAIEASQDAQDPNSLREGIEMVFRQLQQVLEQEGVSTVPGVGEPFDPNMHQAVMQEASSEYESGIIIEEFQKGYRLKDRVIRPSMVKVSS
ncbi:nucleotide exchange factor GrpE [Aneurinibacillus sp. REN35]|uniref:nucleotide exchange factor GrpE n=1 Tax=Aneurinibacillus sp. REN35 TaxID=3237286 RepID=UPI003526E108